MALNLFFKEKAWLCHLLCVYSYMTKKEKTMKTELDFFTTTYHNFGRIKTTKWKADKVIDKLIYNELKKGKK